MIRFQWIGGPTFLLQVGGFRILSDPMLADGSAAFVMNGHPSTGADNVPIARLAPVPPLELSGLDAVIVSHLHSDHFDAQARRRIPKDVPVVTETSGIARLREWGFGEVRGLGWWEEHTLRKGRELLAIVAVPARHAHADALNDDLGAVNGYLVHYTSHLGEWAAYWTGDTVWFDGLTEIQQRAGPIDLLVPHLGAVGVDGPYGRMTLDAAEAVRVSALFRPDTIIPIHYHTFSHYVEPVDVLVERHAAAGAPGRIVALDEGASARLEPRARPHSPRA